MQVIRTDVQELIVQLARKNGKQALVLAESIRAELGEILKAQTDGLPVPSHPVRQTLFAIDEVLLMVEQEEWRGALDAARDAAKEWRAVPGDAQERKGS